MKNALIMVVFAFALIIGSTVGPVYSAEPEKAAMSGKTRIFIVDSYHREYLWSQQTNQGLSEALMKTGYLGSMDEIARFWTDDTLETSKAVFKRLWMDSKHKKEKTEVAKITADFSEQIKRFKPDIILLGDDNAANYIGNQFLDTKIPIIFWGVNNTPVKYGIVDSEEKPGHNVTGVYQTTYYKESLEFLKVIVPTVKTFAVLSDDTTTGRIHNKALQYMDRTGALPLKLVEVVATNNFESWKAQALDLQTRVDAFFIAASALQDKDGVFVSDAAVSSWYMENIKIPETTGFRYRVEVGWLCAADDSGYNQGYEAGLMTYEVLVNHVDPAGFRPRVPARGPLMVNRQRAEMLGITLTDSMGIEEYIDQAAALSENK